MLDSLSWFIGALVILIHICMVLTVEKIYNVFFWDEFLCSPLFQDGDLIPRRQPVVQPKTASKGPTFPSYRRRWQVSGGNNW